MLSQLSRDTGKFVPVLPYYLDVLRSYNFNRKTTKVSMKPVTFDSVLKVGKAQMQENGFKDAVVDRVYSGMLAYLSGQSHGIAFPELAIPCVMQVKDFIKSCKVRSVKWSA